MLQYLLEVEKMEHILKLQPKYFDYINNGTKRIELRLYDEKRQKIAIGDTIIFQKEPELETTMKVKVIGLLRYNTFEELFEDFDIEIMADKSMTKQELLNVLEEFYTRKTKTIWCNRNTYRKNIMKTHSKIQLNLRVCFALP